MAFATKSRLRALMLGGASALASAAFAADKPADDAGAKTVADFIAAYAGQAALPSIKVTQDGGGYRIAFDLAAATAAMKKAGFTYDPATLTAKVFQQDDGQWRIEMADMPPITGHVEPAPGNKVTQKMDIRAEASGFKSVTLLDPKLNWIGAMHGGADKLTVTQHGPGVEQFIEIGGLKFDGKTTSGPEGLTTTATEPMDSINLVMDVDPKGVDRATGGPAKPVHVSAQGEKGHAEIALKDFQPGPVLDAWRFFAAHPEPADVARDFDALKTVLAALVADHAKLEELVTLDKLHVLSQAGPIEIEGAAVGIGAINGGEPTGFSERFAAKSIKLPDGLVPPMLASFVPTAFEFGFVAHGFDLEAGVKEWLADAKVEDGVVKIDKADQDKVKQKMIGERPVVVDIAPSHVVGPSLNLAFEGKITIEATKPTGSITLTVQDFDKTEQAVQGLPPQTAQQLTPAIAMAKGLGKPGPNGALIWVCSIGPDHVMKVNGLPLGKAPF
jgi:hypothetical protein